MYKVIMAPTEGSDSERAAISIATRLAQRFEAQLRLVRVLTAPIVSETIPRTPVLEITENTLREERLARLRKLEALGTEIRALGDIPVITALEDGPVPSTLKAYAEKFNVDLIVMSSHSRGGITRVTLGSVTDYLIRNTNIPVLVVRPKGSLVGATREETVNRIVVPLDGSALAQEILPHVATLALPLNATVSLLRVLTPSTYAQKQIMQPGLPWWDADIAEADAYLADAASSLTEQGVAVNKELLLSDNVTNAILDFASRTKADLLAFATRGNGGMSRFVFGTVADELTRKSPISLLVFHPRMTAVAGEIEVAASRSLAGR
jgi:nucleotide-binding universal stress UspA family protein